MYTKKVPYLSKWYTKGYGVEFWAEPPWPRLDVVSFWDDFMKQLIIEGLEVLFYEEAMLVEIQS